MQWVWKFNLKGNISANHDALHSGISQKIDLTDTLGTKCNDVKIERLH